MAAGNGGMGDLENSTAPKIAWNAPSSALVPQVPPSAMKLTMFVDVHDKLLYYCMTASMLGARVPGHDAKPLRQRKRHTQEHLRKR